MWYTVEPYQQSRQGGLVRPVRSRAKSAGKECTYTDGHNVEKTQCIESQRNRIGTDQLRQNSVAMEETNKLATLAKGFPNFDGRNQSAFPSRKVKLCTLHLTLGTRGMSSVIQGWECPNPPGDPNTVEDNADIIRTTQRWENRQHKILLHPLLRNKRGHPGARQEVREEANRRRRRRRTTNVGTARIHPMIGERQRRNYSRVKPATRGTAKAEVAL